MILNANEMKNTYQTSNKKVVEYLTQNKMKYILCKDKIYYYIKSERLEKLLAEYNKEHGLKNGRKGDGWLERISKVFH